VDLALAGGVEVGLSPDVADALTRQTILGAARLLKESGEPPADLRAAVTSPGGTTARGIAELESRGAADAAAAVAGHLKLLDEAYATEEERRLMSVVNVEMPRAARGSLADLAQWARSLPA